MTDVGNRPGFRRVCRTIKENKFVLLFILVYAFILTMANEFFFASNRMQNYDQAIYQYIGHLITEGKMPYVDAFDHKGPLLYLIYAVSCLISIKWGAWLINFLVMAGTIGVSYCIARRFVGKGWAATVCLVLYSGFITLDFRGGTPEFFAGLFVAVSLYYLLDYYLTGEICRKHLLFLGICGGCIFWLKHSTMITLLLLCVFIIIKYLTDRKVKTAFDCMIWYGLGFAAISAAVCGWLLLNGAGRELIEDYFLANLLYAGNTTLFNRAQSFLYLASHSSVVIIWIMMTIYMILKMSGKTAEQKHTKGNRGLFLDTAASLLISLLVLAMPGRNYYHYLSTLFPLLVLIAAFLLKQLSLAEIPNRFLTGALGVTAVSCLLVWPNLEQIYSLSVNTWTEDTSKTELVHIINQYASDKGTISVLGDMAGLYLASGHESATTYPYILSVVLNDPKRTADYRKQIEKNEPEVIIADTDQNEYDILGSDIINNYYLMDNISSQKIYVRKDRAEFASIEEKLKYVVDLQNYLSLLSEMDDCTVFFAVKDTQGYELTEQILRGMEELGFEDLSELLEKEYHTFIGIAQNGYAIYQKIGAPDEAIRYDGIAAGCSVRLESKTYQYGNLASIQIDDEEYAVNKRGLNIVVYDNKTLQVIDSAAFDTHTKDYICYRKM